MDKYRKIYAGYNDEELKKIWINAIFIFDNNILLDLYRSSYETRQFILNAMNQLKDNIYMPHQIMIEFFRNRTEEIYNTQERYSKLRDQVSKFKTDLTSSLRLDNTDFFDTEIDNLLIKIDEYKKNSVVVENPNSDFILKELIVLFDGKVGDSFTNSELESICIECDKRYSQNIPPGYKDNDKPSQQKYGDYLIWLQMINCSKERNKPIVFISRDQKEDWITVIKGKKQGPRHELRSEFMSKTGNDFHMYDLNQFITYYSRMKGETVDNKIIDDLNSLDRSHQIDENIENMYTPSYYTNLRGRKIQLSKFNQVFHDFTSNQNFDSLLRIYLSSLDDFFTRVINDPTNININELQLFYNLATKQIVPNMTVKLMSTEERNNATDYCIQVLFKSAAAMEQANLVTEDQINEERSIARNLFIQIQHLLKHIAKSISTI